MSLKTTRDEMELVRKLGVLYISLTGFHKILPLKFR